MPQIHEGLADITWVQSIYAVIQCSDEKADPVWSKEIRPSRGA